MSLNDSLDALAYRHMLNQHGSCRSAGNGRYLKNAVLLNLMASECSQQERTSSESMDSMLTARRAVFSTTPNQGAYAVVGLHNTKSEGMLLTCLYCLQAVKYPERGT